MKRRKVKSTNRLLTDGRRGGSKDRVEEARDVPNDRDEIMPAANAPDAGVPLRLFDANAGQGRTRSHRIAAKVARIAATVLAASFTALWTPAADTADWKSHVSAA